MKQKRNKFRPRTSALLNASREEQSINYDVIRLVIYGFATDAIADYTGLTPAQVQYRVATYKLQGKRRDFRRGIAPESIKVAQMALNVPRTVRNGELNKYDAIRQSILAARARGEL